MITDKTIKVSDRAYKFLKKLKAKTGISIKRIIDDFIDENIRQDRRINAPRQPKTIRN